MSQNEPISSYVRRESKNISTSFGSIVQLFDGGDPESAALVAYRLMVRFSNLLEVIRNSSEHNQAYINMVVGNQMTQLVPDITFLETLEKSRSLVRSDFKNVEAIINRMERYIDVLNKEIRHVFPDEFSTFHMVHSVWKNQRKVILSILIPVLIFSTIYFPMMAIQHKKHSLRGDYYDDMTLTHLVKTRNDRGIDFSWDYGAPYAGFRMDQFSIRWTGFLKIDKNGPCQFSTVSDDGVVLWIDGKKIIENWSPHSTQKNFGSAHLVAGYHEIKVEYFELDANAEIHLLWRPKDEDEFAVIPASAFVSSNKYL